MKKETIEEFIARGGKVEKVDYVEPEAQKHTVPMMKNKVPEQMDLTKGALFFAENTRKKKDWKAKAKSFSDIDNIPSELLEKLGL